MNKHIAQFFKALEENKQLFSVGHLPRLHLYTNTDVEDGILKDILRYGILGYILARHSHVTLNYLLLFKKDNLSLSNLVNKISIALVSERSTYVNTIRINEEKEINLYVSESIVNFLTDVKDIIFKQIGPPESFKNLMLSVIKVMSKEADKYLPENLSLDYTLHGTDFANLNNNLKDRCVKNEFLEEYGNNNVEINNELVENIKTLIKENKTKEIKNQITDILYNINERQLEIDNLLTIYYEKTDKLVAAENFEIDLSKLSRISKDSRIHKMYFNKRYNSIVIYTNPIMLNFEEAKKHTTNATNNLKENEKLCIGVHKIIIKLDGLQVSMEPLNRGLLNHHIERYRCFGQFGNSINEAKKNYDIPRLISLHLQAFSHVTLGDPAGNDTVNSAILIKKTGEVKDSKEHYSTYFFKKEHIREEHYNILIEEGIIEWL